MYESSVRHALAVSGPYWSRNRSSQVSKNSCFPVRSKVTARFSGHQDNIALQQQILDAVGCPPPAKYVY
jgi:hypothetical protein